MISLLSILQAFLFMLENFHVCHTCSVFGRTEFLHVVCLFNVLDQQALQNSCSQT
jgi:hypothetical protein